MPLMRLAASGESGFAGFFLMMKVLSSGRVDGQVEDKVEKDREIP